MKSLNYSRNRMKSIYTILFLFLSFIFSALSQEKMKFPKIDLAQDSTAEKQECGHNHFNLGSHSSGISFGNSKYHNGIRFNYRDCDVKHVNGLNFTLWQGYEQTLKDFTINGISLGTIPVGGTMNGITFGFAGAIAMRNMTGINFGGLALVSPGGNITGINISGLGIVSPGGSITGINFGGLALVSPGGNITGLNFGGLAVVSAGGSITGVNVSSLALVSPDGNITGLNFGGLAVVSPGGDIKGINIAGLALVSPGGSITGINFGGLAVVSPGGDIKGINISGLAIVSPTGNITGVNATLGVLNSPNGITGVNLAGYKIEAKKITGLNIAPVWIETESITGLTVTGYCKVKGTQTGVSIALVNNAEFLNGLQIGLLNIARQNSGLNILPFVNLHLGL